MNKFVIFAGIIVGTILLFQFKSGKIATNDILYVMETQNTDEESQNTDEDFSSHVYASILPSDIETSEDLTDFFTRLKNTQDVSNFIIISENHTRRGLYNIAGSADGYETPFGYVEPDLSMLENLSLESSSIALRGENSISVFAPLIKEQFPDAKITSIFIKEFAKDDELKDLSDKLIENTNDDTVLIVSTNFSEKISYLTALFHDELAKNAIETLDQDAISQMDVDSRPAMNVLFDYVIGLGAETSDIYKNYVISDKSYFFVNFYEGSITSDDRDLTIMAFGDMMFSRYVRTLMDQYGKNYVFDKIDGSEKRFFDGADVIFGNFEGPINGEGTSGGTSMVFSFNEDIVPFLKSYGFNLLSITNNHAVDQGWQGRDNTIAAFNANNLGWCGHPSETDKNSVYYEKVKDKTFAFICFQDVTFKLNDEKAIKLIKEVRPNVDYLIVSAHWGYEYKHSPDSGTQIEPGRAFIDAGADFIIGHHPHVVQSFEEYNGKLIFYSLGNFVFDQYWSTETQEELAIGIVLGSSSTKVFLFPMKSELSQSRLLTDEEYDKWIDEFISYGDYSEEMKDMIRDGIIEIKN